MIFNRALAYVFFSSLLGVANIAPAIAQSIVPAPDGTNTIVTPEGNRIDITGGVRSRDGENLFHSLTRFGLTPQEIANFLSLPEVRNILVRINGGEASFINGLIQVTGGNSNLFLMNPSGIVFGSNASLNVPAAFIATTANGIGFGNNWFNATGVNNYTDLVGTPSTFAFTMSQPGSILNAGNLAVGIGQDLGLIGGTVINTGNLTAPEGNIRLMAVQGQSLVRLSQPGFVLSLDIQPQQTIPNNWTLPILSLPQLLTGGIGGNATGVTVNPDGSVQLTGSGIGIPTDAGTVIASGTLDASAPPLGKGGQGGIGGTVDILGNKVGVVSANINASGNNNGGKVRIGGDYKGQGTVPNASFTYVSGDTVISVDSFTAGNGGRAIVWADDTTRFYGTITARGGKIEGNGGFVETSGKNGLDVTGASVDASATKGLPGNWLLDPHNVTIQFFTPSGTSSSGGNPDIFTAIADNAVILPGTIESTLAKGTSVTINTGTTGTQQGNITVASAISPTLTGGDATLTLDAANDIFVNAIINNISSTNKLNVVLSAGGNVNAKADIITGGGNINVKSGGAIDTSAATLNASSTTGDGGAIALTATGNITTNAIAFGPSGGGVDNTLKIDTPGVVNINGDITNNGADIFIGGTTPVSQVNLNFSGDTFSTFGGDITINSSGALTLVKNLETEGGAINLKGTSINTTPVNLDSSNEGDGGAIALTATNNINTGNIDTTSLINGGTSGTVTITSSGGSIDTSAGTIDTRTIDNVNANGGAVTITAKNDIITGGISTFVGLDSTGKAGNISLTSTAGTINTKARLDAGTTNGSGGEITLFAKGNITSQDLLSYVVNNGTGNGGKISVTSTEGAFNITQGRLDSSSNSGNGGDIFVSAAGDITTGSDFRESAAVNSISLGNGNGGKISFTSSGGAINTTAGNVESTAQNGNGGAIALSAKGNITTGEVFSFIPEDGTGIAGNVSFTSSEGNITANSISAVSDNGSGGAIALNAKGDITAEELRSAITEGGTGIAGNVSLTSSEGNITADSIETASANGTGGAIALNAKGNIIAGELKSYIAEGNTGNAGNVSLTSSEGNITADIINARSDNGSSGAIELNAKGDITAKNIFSFVAEGGTGTGGNISFTSSAGAINAGNINATGSSNGGDISLTSDQINFTAGDNSVESNNGTLLLQPFTPSQNLSLAPITIAPFKDGFDSITIGRIDGTGNITIAAPITFSDPTIVQSPGGAIAINAPITGIDNASITLTAATNNLKANITTAEQDITINGNTTLGNNTILSTGTKGDGNIIITGEVNGNNNLTLETGTGDIVIAGAIGGTTRLGNFTINSASSVTTKEITAASITQKAGSGTTTLGALNTNKAAGINLTGNSFNLNGNITTTNNGGFKIDNSSPLTLIAEKFNLDGSFNQVGTGAVSISGNLTTTNDNISFKAPVTLTGNTEFNAGTALISINSSLTGGSNNLTLTADGIELGGTISGNGNLVLQPFTPSQAIALGIPTNSGEESLDLSQGELNNLQDGFTSITIGRDNGSGTISIADSISFQDPVTIQSPLGAGTIVFNGGTIAGTDNATIELIANQTIKTGDINAPAGITITSNSGEIDSSAGKLDASNLQGSGGAIALTASGNITTGAITSEGISGGGNVTITSSNGGVNTKAGNIETITVGSVTGNGGTVTINAKNDIDTGSILTNIGLGGTGKAGNISLTSTQGNINTSAGILDAGTTFGSGGEIALNALGNITTGKVRSYVVNDGSGDGGNISFTSGGEINTTGGDINSFSENGNGGKINFTAAGNINTGNIDSSSEQNGNGGAINITSSGGEINTKAGTLDSTSKDGKAGAIALSSPNSITVAGIDATGNPGGDIRLTSNGINFTGIANSIRSNGTLTLQPFTPNDNLILNANNLGTLQDGFSAIAIGWNNGTGTITLPNPIAFSDPVIIQSPNGSILINGAITGLDNASITLTGNTTLNANITTTNQDLNINGNSTLGSNVTLATGGGNLVINGTVDGNNNLTLEAGNGNITLNNPIGNTTRLGNFTINSANNVQTQSITAASIAQITGSGTTNFGNLNTNSSAGIDLTGNIFNFNGNIDASNNGGLRINNSGNANIPATTNINLDGAFNQIGAGGVSIGGNIITTNDDIRFNGAVTLTGNATFNPGIAAIAFNSTLNTGNNPLTLTASEIDFGGAVSGTNSLTLQPATPEQNITIGGSLPGNLNLTTAEIANLQDGFSAIAIGRADGTGTITVNSVIFNDPVTIQSGLGAIAINQPISGIGNASITLDAATTTLNANITTAGQNLTIGRNTILGADVTLSTLNSGDIIFNGPVNGTRQLSLNAGTGSIRFNGGAGLITPLSSLNITSAQNVFVAGGIAINGDLTLNTPVTLTEDATFRIGSIVFNNTLDSEANEGNDLTINAGGNISFNGAVGSNGRLGAIAIENANDLTATSTIQAGSIQHLNGTGIINLAGDVTTTGGGVNLTTRGNIRTGNIISNSGEIRLNSREGTVTTGTLDVSSEANGGAILLRNAGAIALTSPQGAVTTGNLNASGVTAGGNITVISGDRINTGNINVSATVGNGGTVILDPPNDIQVGFINAEGGSSGIGGNVDITTERFFRATNTFTDRNNLTSSISTAGGAGMGTITIRHGGGDLRTPFTVGDATINGTAAALTTGIDTISPIRIFPGRYTQGNIAIITSGQLIAELTDSTIRRENTLVQNTIANIPPASIDIIVGALEEVFTRDYETYLGKLDITPIKTLGEISLQLRRTEEVTGVKTAVIYIVFGRGKMGIEALLACSLDSRNPEITSEISQQETCRSTDNDPVEMVLVTAEGEPIRTRISGATRAQVLAAAKQLRTSILEPENRNTTKYLEPAKQLYQWLIAPIEADLKARGIQNIVFIPDAGLRTTPLAALHNGQNFIISQYSISLMPSFSLTRPRYVNLRDASVLAMGASKFTDLSPLPAVPVELSTITPQLWPGTTELNEGFTVENLKLERTVKSYRIVHLATHAQFQSGPPSNSYIQFWDKKVSLDQMEQFNWNNPPVELLVLSACRTAIGDRQVELGFAGLAVQAGVQSALASLWYVSDEGTLGLMTEFYEQLKTAPTRAEALRRAQLAMVTGEVRLEGGLLYGPTRQGISLPSALVRLGDVKFSHPYYWSAFTMIGNPW